MIEQGVDNLGAEFKRTSYDFSFKHLSQNNCVCSICHGTGAEYALRYITRDYSSARQKKRICKTLQAHEHSFWICPACVENFTTITGLRVIQAKSEQPHYATGFWLIRKWGDDAKCSNCGRTSEGVYDMDNYDAFCRCCGAKMEGLRVIK